MERQQTRKQKLKWAGQEIHLCIESPQSTRYFTFRAFPTSEATEWGKYSKVQVLQLIQPQVLSIGRAPVIPPIWAPNGNVKINITTIAELEGSKRHRKKDAPKGKRQCLGRAVMANEVKKHISWNKDWSWWKQAVILEHLASAKVIIPSDVCVDMNVHVNTFSSFKANADVNRLKSSQRVILLTDKTLSAVRSVGFKKITGHFL